MRTKCIGWLALLLVGWAFKSQPVTNQISRLEKNPFLAANTHWTCWEIQRVLDLIAAREAGNFGPVCDTNLRNPN